VETQLALVNPLLAIHSIILPCKTPLEGNTSPSLNTGIPVNPLANTA